MTTTSSTDSQPIEPTKPADRPSSGDPPTEQRVAELESELDRVKADRSAEQERLDRRDGWRRFFSTTLAIVAAVSIVFSVTGIWLRTTALNSERFAAAAAPLTKNDDVARAISEFAAAEIVTHTGAEQEIQRVLPADAQALAGPITSGLQDGLTEVVDDVVQTDEFQAVFETAVRLAHEEALVILDGDGDVVESSDGQVTINLLSVINGVVQAAAADLSSVLGTTITVPTISADDVPADQIAELESALGVQLPPDFGQVTLFQSSELAEAQTWVNRFDTWLEVMIVVAIAATIGAFALAFDRRRTVITLGITIPVATVLTWLLVDGTEDEYYKHIEDPTGRAAARAATDVVFAGLDRVAWWTIGLSLAAVVVAVLTRDVTVGNTGASRSEPDDVDSEDAAADGSTAEPTSGRERAAELVSAGPAAPSGGAIR